LVSDLNGEERWIVYCLQKGWAKDLCEFLNKELGEEICEIYHADLSKYSMCGQATGDGQDLGGYERSRSWDRLHVRFVIHQGQSQSLMDFSQESGRAGRDGKEARSVIFTSKELAAKM
jgi:superfamily II DNA helicase RecQ